MNSRNHLAPTCAYQRLAATTSSMVVVVTDPSQGAHMMHHTGRVRPLQRIAATAVGIYCRDVIEALMKVVQLESRKVRLEGDTFNEQSKNRPPSLETNAAAWGLFPMEIYGNEGTSIEKFP